jgi:hypothetical protein
MNRLVVACSLFGLLLFSVEYSQRINRAIEPEPVSYSWDAFLDTLQTRTIHYFLHATNPSSGLTPDRTPSNSPSSIAAVGFALTTYPIASERRIIPRTDAASRALTTLRFLLSLPQNDRPVATAGHKGFFYHFIDANTGIRFWNCELSTIDTGLLMAGVLFAQAYFDGNNGVEQTIRTLADSLYRRVDWKWAMADTKGIVMGWTPERSFHGKAWRGYSEAMIMYILALGSPTYPVPSSVWEYWSSTYVWAEYYGREFVSFGPLFGHQYSHCWIDFRGIQDSYMKEKGIDYFENSRRATYSQRAYAMENPFTFRGYSDTIWGFTACDGPGDTTFLVDGKKRKFSRYEARGVSFDWVNDDGTIAPTAAGGSVAFAPEICVPTLKTMKERYGARLWREFGFLDAFNPTFITARTGEAGWFDADYLGIDQGPIVIMIENLRNGFVWNIMKKNPYVVEGLKRARFTGGWLSQ